MVNRLAAFEEITALFFCLFVFFPVIFGNTAALFWTLAYVYLVILCDNILSCYGRNITYYSYYKKSKSEGKGTCEIRFNCSCPSSFKVQTFFVKRIFIIIPKYLPHEEWYLGRIYASFNFCDSLLLLILLFCIGKEEGKGIACPFMS